MYKILTKDQRKDLLKELKSERSRRYAERIKVILLLDEGQTYKNISHFLFLDESTIANYRKRYFSNGIEGLIYDDYHTNRIKLSPADEKLLSQDIENGLFLSTKEVVAHIKKKFKREYSISGCNNLLHRLGFSLKKAKGVPGKAKKKDQEVFIKMYNSLPCLDDVYFGDATHPLHNSILSYGWIKKGTEKEVLTNSGRFRVNLFGAINIKNFDIVTRSYPTINQSSVCDFLKSLRAKKDKNKKLYLILDRGPCNKAKSVQELAKELNIQIIYLPAYSPNLNPIERLWKFFKKKILYNKYYEKVKDFKNACTIFFRGIRKYKSELSTLITDNFTAVGT